METDEFEKLKAELFLQEQLYRMKIQRAQRFDKLKVLRQKINILKQELSENNENLNWRANA